MLYSIDYYSYCIVSFISIGVFPSLLFNIEFSSINLSSGLIIGFVSPISGLIRLIGVVISLRDGFVRFMDGVIGMLRTKAGVIFSDGVGRVVVFGGAFWVIPKIVLGVKSFSYSFYSYSSY